MTVPLPFYKGQRSPKNLTRHARVQRLTSSALILKDLRTDIMNLTRAPGSAISEKEIASNYQVSRTPVREALLKLREEGLVNIFPQSGTFVSRIPVYALRESIIIRQALEMMSAKLAAEQASKEAILRLEDNLTRTKTATNQINHSNFHVLDDEFHAIIADIAGYPGLWHMGQLVKVQMDRYRRLTLPQDGRLKRIISEHQAINDAIALNDGRAAAEAMANHLEKLMEDLDCIQSMDPQYFATDPHE